MQSRRSHPVTTGEVLVIREFNRFYTARLGLLRKHYLDEEFSLTEAQVLYEIDALPDQTAAELRERLGLDKGYVSRLLTLLTRRKLIKQKASSVDAREKLLTLTPQGRTKVAALNDKSANQIGQLLEPLEAAERQMVVEALCSVRSLLSREEQTDVKIVRVHRMSAEILELLEEYYTSINVVQRDTDAAMRKMIGSPNSALWLAYVGRITVGCVVLKNLGALPRSGECKRLYVKAMYRGRGIAGKLLDALETHAHGMGLKWVYLDSKDDLTSALAVYRKRGYVSCERYNDNPQATVFLRKQIQRRALEQRTRRDAGRFISV